MLLIVHLFEFGRWYVANRFQESLLVEPGHPVESGELDSVDSLPRAVLSNDLGLVQADHRFGQRVVIGIALASNRGLDPRIRRAAPGGHITQIRDPELIRTCGRERATFVCT